MSNVAYGRGGVWGSRTSEEAEYRVVWTDADDPAGHVRTTAMRSLAKAKDYRDRVAARPTATDVRVQVRAWQDVEEQA